MPGTEHRQPGALNASPLRSPTAVFSRPPDQCFLARRSLSSLSARGRSPVTAFPSPTTTPACAKTHSGVKGPGLLLRFPLPGSIARSALPLRYLCRFAPASPPHRFWPLQLRQIARLAAPPASTPLRDFYLLGIKAFNRICACQTAFRIRPISSRSRSPLSITRFLGCGSPFLVRYVSEACCSSNLLEPLSLCPPQRSLVNSF